MGIRMALDCPQCRRLTEEVEWLNGRLRAAEDRRAADDIRRREASRRLALFTGETEPDPEDASGWDWPSALAYFERVLQAEQEALTDDERARGLDVGHQLDLAAARLTAQELAGFEDLVARHRAAFLRGVAQKLDDLHPGNGVAEHLRANTPETLVDW